MPLLQGTSAVTQAPLDPLAQEVRVRAAVRRNIRYHCRYYFGWDLEEFHLEALEAMFDGGHVIVNWATDHAKSTMGTFLFPLLSLMENPDETHIICGANINDSKRRVQALQREIETNKELVKDFPWLAKPQEKDLRIWSATQFNVVGRTINKPNPSVLAAAVGSNDVKGRRGKLMMDDIEGEDARWSPLKRQQLYSWLTLEAWRCFEDKHESLRPLMCLLGTPFDVDSIYFRMEAQEWKVLRHGAYIEQRSEKTHKPVYLWPAKAQKVEQARKRLRKLEFSVAYLMDPTGGDPSKVSAAELTKATQEARFEHTEHIGLVSLDPAAGGQGQARADYAGIAVVKVHWKVGEAMPNVEILEAHSMTQGLFEQVHFCAALSANYRFPVIYETNSQQGQVYRDTFNHLHPETQLLRHYTTRENKFDNSMGLSVVKTLMVDRRIRVPAERIEDEGITTLIHEIRDLAPPFNQHDHIAAAIWFAIRHAYEQVRYFGLAQVENGFRQGNLDWYHRQSPYYGGRQSAMQASRQFGYRPWTWQEDVVARERRKEEERFVAQLRSGRR